MPIAHPVISKLISTKVDDQVPQSIRDNHPNFVVFLRKFYEWLEQEGNAYEIIGNLIAYGDIDRTTTNFIEFFEKQFIADIPDGILVDKNWLIKNIREWYRQRGTRSSYEFLFRILFDDDITFRLPKDELLRSSDGRWFQQKTIKTTFNAGILSLEGRPITGLTSGTTAIIESVLNTAENGNTMAEIVISSFDGVFTSGETIRGVDSAGTNVDFTLFDMLSGFIINTPGNGYSIGDPLIFNPPSAGSGTISAEVSELTTGEIASMTIVNGGDGFFPKEYLTIDNTGDLDDVTGESAQIKVKSIIAQAEDLTPNGDFPANVTSWTDSSIGAATMDWNAGAYMNLNDTDDSGTSAAGTQQQSGLDVGVEHTITFDTLDNAGVRVRIGLAVGGTEFLNVSNLPIGTDHSFVFTPTVPDPFLAFILNETGGGAISAGVDNVRISRNDKNYVTNPTFDTDVTSWTEDNSGTGTTAWGAGTFLNLNGGASGTGARYQTLSLVNGRKYSIEINVVSNPVDVRIGTTIGGTDVFQDSNVTPKQNEVAYFTAGATNILWVGNSANTDAGVDNITIRAGGVVTELEIENPGTGYLSLPTFDGTGVDSGSGATFTPIPTNIGGIKKISIIKPGFGVTVAPTVDMSVSGNGDAIITALTDPLFIDSDGRWLTTDSILDSNRVLQDSDFFQEFSYVIKSGISFNLWEDIVKKLLHPAGTKLFGEVSTSQTIAAPLVSFTMTAAQEFDLILTPRGGSTSELDMSATIFTILTLPIQLQSTPTSPPLAGGSERLLLNDEFDVDLSEWVNRDEGTGVSSWNAGTMRLNGSIGNRAIRSQIVTGLEIGRWYQIDIFLSAGTTGLGVHEAFEDDAMFPTMSYGTGLTTITFKATATSAEISCNNGSASTADIDWIIMQRLKTDQEQTLSNSWNHWEYTKSLSPGFSVLKWGETDSASWNAGHFSAITADFIDANRYASSNLAPAPEVQELIFEDYEAVGSPNTTFWNSAATTGARSAVQSILGSQSFLFSGTQTMRSEIVQGDKAKLGFWFYASSTGTDSGTDTTRLASIHENASSDGASIFINNSGGNRYLGAASGTTSAGNDFQITQDTWYYVELIVDGGAGTFEMKIDRSSVTTGSVSGVTAIDRIEIGHNSNQSANFISYIDTTRAYLKF